MKASRYASSVGLSATGAVDEMARKLAREGREVFNFGVGQPDFDTPSVAADRAVRAIGEGKTRYTSPRGTIELRRVVAEKLTRDNDLRYDPEEEILISCGAKHSIHSLLSAVLNPGEEVLLPTPTWVSYPAMVRLLGGVPRNVPATMKDRFRIDPERLRAALSPRTVGLILNSPCNPTGAVYSGEELSGLAQVIEEAGLWVITDEIYEKIVFDGRRHESLPAVAPNLRDSVAVVNGVSKAFAMTGWRIGYAAGPPDWIGNAAAIQSHQTGNACSVSQEAAMAVLSSPDDTIELMRAEFQRRRDLVVSMFSDIKGLELFEPEGTFYVLPSVQELLGSRVNDSALSGDAELVAWLLGETGVATVPGTAFAAPGHIRVSFASDLETLKRGLHRLGEALVSLGSSS